jgi:ElaB/YqjD/DUF883 family membrane-anchored ribosome-binding protein
MAHATDGGLKRDFRVGRDSAEDLLKATTDLGGERLVALRARVDQALKTMKTRVSETHEAVVERARADARAANAYVHGNPWKAVGIAAGAGLLVGVVLARR